MWPLLELTRKMVMIWCATSPIAPRLGSMEGSYPGFPTIHRTRSFPFGKVYLVTHAARHSQQSFVRRRAEQQKCREAESHFNAPCASWCERLAASRAALAGLPDSAASPRFPAVARR
jgi:hypothetical protein